MGDYTGMIRMESTCLSCLLKRDIDLIPESATEEERYRYKQQLLRIAADAERTVSPPEIARDIQHLQIGMFGHQVDYPQIKSYFNEKMMQYVPQTEERIRQAADPLRRALQFSMCGNYIDFGVPQNVTEEMLERILADSENIRIDDAVLQEIRSSLERARSVVFLHDNCGEIVMDKLLIAEIRRQFPQAKVTSVVRGGEIVNDVTMEDAIQVGMQEVADVVANGDDVAGTCLMRITEELRQILRGADIIFAKGQGNFETLRGSDMNTFYMFLCKCEVFERRFDVSAFTGMIVHERDAQRVR